MQEKNMGHICPIGRSGVKRHLIKIYTKTHHIIISEELALEHLCHAQHAVSRHAYIHFWKNYLHVSVKSCNVWAFIAFLEKITIRKGRLFPIFKRSTSIHKNNPA